MKKNEYWYWISGVVLAFSILGISSCKASCGPGFEGTWTGHDKRLHLGISSGMTAFIGFTVSHECVSQYGKKRGIYMAYGIGFVISEAVGIIKELAIDSRPSGRDLAADTVGNLAVFLTATTFRVRW